MASWRDVANVWKNVREVDLRPIREEALQEVRIALVGEPGSGRHTLAEQFRNDPARLNMRTNTPINILGLDSEEDPGHADLVVILVAADGKDFGRQRALAHQWTSTGLRVVVFYNTDGNEQAGEPNLDVVWDVQQVFVGNAGDAGYLTTTFVPAIIELLPDQLLALGRHFPLFRVPIAQRLINEASFSNAAYSLSTGLAEIVPILGVPLNVTDMVVLTKAQAFMVYRLGLTLGFSTRWQDYVSEFGSVIGGGFLWRQLARYLVGLIPIWGIVPKVAVAYSGTFVVGQVILRWYLTGRQVSPKQIQDMYRQSFQNSLAIARNLVSKTTRPRLGRRKPAELPPPASVQVCPNCGQTSASDAAFCQYCGQPLPGSAAEAG